MTVLAIAIGYLLGALPTAGWLAKRLKGVDLRSVGSGNPGANNALQTGGAGLAAAVLVVEMAKGAAAVLIGERLGGEAAAVAAGLGAVAGNLYNVFYRFKGGKGLGITAGILVTAWPTALVPCILVIALGARLTRSSGAAAIIAIVALVGMGVTWMAFDLPVGWGLSRPGLLMLLALGVGVLIWPKHWVVARFTRSSPA
jgi:glycerol-3-phosphate acyltransferase PlsY